MLQLPFWVPRFCSLASEGQDQGSRQAVWALLLAGGLRDYKTPTVENLRQSGMPREKEVLKCRACGREAAPVLCRYHEEAEGRVRAAYPHWVKAYGRMEWKDYLDSVKRNPQTGQWAKEIAELLKGDSE